MIKLSGVLTIRVINGRFGDFRIGRLLTDIGEFSVKDAVLDQYDEGSYEGEFGVIKIYPSHYSTGGRLVVEVRAELGSIALSNINLLEQETTSNSLEQDPIEDLRATARLMEDFWTPSLRTLTIALNKLLTTQQ